MNQPTVRERSGSNPAASATKRLPFRGLPARCGRTSGPVPGRGATGEGDGEGGQQDVVDARVELRRDLAEQGGRGLRSDRDGPGPLPFHGVGLGERAPAERLVGGGQGRCPVRAVRVERGAGEELGPAAERGARRGRFDALPRAVPVPGGGQVVHQDAPGHAVDHQVVGDQDEAARGPAPDGAQHDAVVGVERLGGAGDALGEGGVALLPAARRRRGPGMSKLQCSPRTSLARSMSWRVSTESRRRRAPRRSARPGW